MLSNVQELVCAFSGLKPLEDFRISYFLSNPFTRRSRSEIDAYLNCGCPQTTPSLAALSSDWPRPWFFWRMLLFGLLVLLIFVVGVCYFHNWNMFPGLIVAGAFFVPLACVALFFELNVLRDISLYQVLKLIVGGGAVSLVLTLFLNKATELDRLLGDMSAGIVEEIAKVLVAVFVAVALVRGTQQSKWILHGLLVGAAVGAGFGGFESAGYIFRGFLEDLGNALAGYDHGLTNFYSTLVLRQLFAPFCHVVWTASVVGALWRVKKDQPFRFSMLFHKDFLRVLAFVVLLHMLWNSGLLWMTSYPQLEVYLWLMSVVCSWYLVLLLVQEGLWQVRDAKSATASESKASLFADKIEPLHVPKEAVARKWLISSGTLLLIAAFGVGALVVKNVQDQAAKQDWSTKNAPKPRQLAPEYVPPAQRLLAPEGYLFLTKQVDAFNGQNLQPGTLVRRLWPDRGGFSVTADGTQFFYVPPDYVTNDTSSLPSSVRIDATYIQSTANTIAYNLRLYHGLQ